MTFRASSETGAAILTNGSEACADCSQKLWQGRRPNHELWGHACRVAVTLSIFGLVMAVILALDIAVWVPLGRLGH